MMNLNKYLIFLLMSMLTWKLQAGYIGGDIQYQYLGNNQYKIIGRIYRDCRNVSIGKIRLTSFSGNNGSNACGSQVDSMNLVSITDISTVCSTAQKPCNPQNTYANRGIEAHLYEKIIDISKAPYSTWLSAGCCELSFAIDGGNRTTYSNATFASNAGAFVICSMNVCNLKKTNNSNNNSVVFYNKPIPFIPYRNKVADNWAGLDTSEDGDRVVYKMVSPISALPNSVITYYSPYSSRYPIKPYCNPVSIINCSPKTSAYPPLGLFFDSITGNIVFTPFVDNQVGAMAIQANEYRVDKNGVELIVGSAMRESYYFVLDSFRDQLPPENDLASNYTVCRNSNRVITGTATDEIAAPGQIIPDKLSLELIGKKQNKILKILNPDSANKNFNIKISSITSDTNNTQELFVLNISDNSCQFSLLNRSAIVLQYFNRVFSVKKQISVDQCGKIKYSLTPLSKEYSSSVTVNLLDSKRNLIKSSSFFQDSLQARFGGKHYIQILLNQKCIYEYLDSIVVPNFGTIGSQFKDLVLCGYRDTFIYADKINTQSPYLIKWYVNGNLSLADTGFKVFRKSWSYNSYSYEVEDGNGCIYKSSISVKDYSLPYQYIFPDAATICYGDSVLFEAQYKYSGYTFSWSNGNKTGSSYYKTAGKAKLITTEVATGCKSEVSVNVVVNKVITPQINRTLICNSIHSKAVSVDLSKDINPTTYQWRYFNTNLLHDVKSSTDLSSIISKAGGRDTSFKLFLVKNVTVNNKTCSIKDTINFKFVNSGKLVVSKLPSICANTDLLNLQDSIKQLPVKKLNAKNFDIYGRKLSSFVTANSCIQKNDSANFQIKSSLIDYTQLKNKSMYSEKIFYKVIDSNGCVFLDSTSTIQLKEIPVIEMVSPQVCQNNNEFSLKSVVTFPIIDTNKLNWLFKCKSAPVGININKVITRRTTPSIEDYLVLGDKKELGRTGNYEIEFCGTYKNNGCSNCSSKILTVTDGPLTILKPGAVCQKLGEFKLSNLVVSPALSSNYTWTFNCVYAPVGISTGGRIYKKIVNQPGEYITFGKSFERQYSGNYGVEYCSSVKGLNCFSCDTTILSVKDLPVLTVVKNIEISRLDTLFDLGNLFLKDSAAYVYNLEDTFTVISLNGNTQLPTGVLGIVNGHFIKPNLDGPGLWMYNLKAKNTCGTSEEFGNLIILDGPVNARNYTRDIHLFQIYPNPNNGTFSIRSSNGEGISEISISDLNGRILYSQKTKDSKSSFKFNKSDLAKGVYLVTINKTVCLKMVID